MKLGLGVGLFVVIAASTAARADGGSFAGLVPEPARAALEAAVRGARIDEAALSGGSVAFVSGESFSESGESIVNRISFFPGERFDLWWMRQRVVRADAKASLLLLAVDKAAEPPRAVYLEFDGEMPLVAGQLPRPRAFSAACYTCHASGPRAIRPRTSADGPAPDAEGRARIAAWNETIARYRVVATHVPVLVKRAWPPIALQGAAENEVVAHPACAQCHADDGGVRASLRRQHAVTMRFLMDHGAMPLSEARLADDERACLDHWLQHPGEAPRAGCDERGAVARKAPFELRVDPVTSRVDAVASSTIGSIPVRGAVLSGGVTCEEMRGGRLACAGELRADLRRAATGIALRDRHLRENLLNTDERPFAVLTLPHLELPGWNARVEAPVRVEVAGRAADYTAVLACTRSDAVRCRIEDLALRLSRHGIEPPSFLGATVDDRVAFTGSVRFLEVR